MDYRNEHGRTQWLELLFVLASLQAVGRCQWSEQLRRTLYGWQPRPRSVQTVELFRRSKTLKGRTLNAWSAAKVAPPSYQGTGCGQAPGWHSFVLCSRCLRPASATDTHLHATLYYTILYYTILYYTILYYTILYYTVLYCTVLYCTVLHYTILYYIV